MTDQHEDPVDLSPLIPDAALRAARLAARVREQVAAARRADRDAFELRAAIRERLARLAIPAAIAAAAGVAAVLVAGSPRPGVRPEPFAPAVLAGNPAMGWIAMDRRPDLTEIVGMLRGGAR